MNIEIVEFYEIKRDDERETMTGTLHAYLIDLGIDVRGIYVTKKKDSIFFSLPSRKAQNSDGEDIQYPTFSFRDREKNSQFMQIIRKEGRLFIENYLKTHLKEKPLDNLTAKLDLKKPAVSPVVSTIKTKEWTTPPPRPAARSGSRFLKR